MWLTEKRGKANKQASDIISRCNRLERVFNLSLDSVVASNSKFETLLERIGSEADSYMKSVTMSSIGQLRSAARVYQEYKYLNKR
jgi:hypothetical protein